MTINKTAVSVVLPAVVALILALLALSRAAQAQSQAPGPPPAPAATIQKPPTNAEPVRTTPRPAKKDGEEPATRSPFTSTSSVKVIRYGRPSRAYF